MAKKAKRVEDLGESGDQYSDDRDDIQAAIQKQIQTHYKTLDMLSHAETVYRCGGIALPSLCLRYLMHQEAFPLGRTLSLSGLFGSNKTSLAFEIARWILTYRGMGWYNDVEKKDSPGMRESLMRYNEEFLKNLPILPCSTQEQWQGGVSAQFKTIIEHSKKKGGKLRVLGCSIVDSVAAANPEKESLDFMGKHGGAGRRAHPTVALYNSKWLSDVVHFVSAGPFILLLIQHSAEVQNEATPGITTRRQKGGMEVAFAKTTAFELTRKKSIKETSNGGGVIITIECSKNALGPAKRKIEVPVKWLWEPDPVNPGRSRQVYYWDWHYASMSLIFSFEQFQKTLWKQINEICDFHKESGGRVWSKKLGIDKSAPLKFSAAWELLEYDHPYLLPDIYNLLHIQRRPLMPVGGDLGDLWDGQVGIKDIPDPPPYSKLLITEQDDEDGE